MRKRRGSNVFGFFGNGWKTSLHRLLPLPLRLNKRGSCSYSSSSRLAPWHQSWLRGHQVTKQEAKDVTRPQESAAERPFPVGTGQSDEV
jgi:hypothetical protein